jgi:hypothetical protein
MKRLFDLKTEMLIDVNYINVEIAKAMKLKNVRRAEFFRGKRAVVNHYLKQVNRLIKDVKK